MARTIVTGRNQYGDVIIRIETTYEERFEVINQVMDMEEVTAVTTNTTIRNNKNRGWQNQPLVI